MNSYFASAERVTKKELDIEVEIISKSSIIDSLLKSVCGLLCILNEQRQVIALNESFLKTLGIDNPDEALGLRPGEALNCIYSDEEPGGCGTSKFCSTCGAALAIVTSLSTNNAVERFCSITAIKNNKNIDIALQVKAQPLIIDGRRIILLFMQDITLQQQRAALERTFFHDVNNMLNGLVWASQLLSEGNSSLDLIKIISNSSKRLQKEIEIQRCLSQSEPYSYNVMKQETSVLKIFEEIESFFASHPVKLNKHLRISRLSEDLMIKTDTSLLSRVLFNMITNALEATDDEDEVHLWIKNDDNNVTFYVKNNHLIPEDIKLRVFQRNYSTKEGSGRGIGTFSMKLFGEKILGGKVDFTSSQDEGTVFSFSLPLNK